MSDKFYFNGGEDNELTNRIFDIISTSNSYIKTGNFFFKDARLQSALLDASKRGVAVFVLSNTTGGEDRSYKRVDVKTETDPHISNLHELSNAGIHVRLSKELHAKFIIGDGTEGLIMSANYTMDSLYGNPENGVDVSDEELTHLEYVFDKMFLHPDTVLSEDAKKYRYMDRNQLLEKGAFDSIIGGSRLLLTAASGGNSSLKDCNYTTIYSQMVDMVNQAEKFIKIVSWSYNRVECLSELHESLQKAMQRGVLIDLYYGTKAEEWKVDRSIEQLKKLVSGDDRQCRYHPLKNNHSKCVITDKGGMMFTSNIDGDKGLLTGFELGCILTEEQRKNAMDQLNKLMNDGK